MDAPAAADELGDGFGRCHTLSTTQTGSRVQVAVDMRARLQERAKWDSWIGERIQQVHGLEQRDLRTNESLKGTTPGGFYLTIHEFAQILAINDSMTRRLVQHETDVLNLADRGGKRATIRVPVKVLARIINRCAIRRD